MAFCVFRRILKESIVNNLLLEIIDYTLILYTNFFKITIFIVQSINIKIKILKPNTYRVT